MTLDTSPRDGGMSRSLVWLNYGLLFAAVFFAGAPALIAVVIAYAQRDQAPAPIRRHYDFQIRIFWVALILCAAAAACLTAVLVTGMAALYDYSGFGDALAGWTWDLSGLWANGGGVLILSVATVVLSALAMLWVLIASMVGAVRLASAPRIGHSPAP